MQSVQFTSMYTRISTKSGVWVCFSSSSKQDALFKSHIALGINRTLMILYCIASWQKCHGASYAIGVSLSMPHQKIALAMANQLNQQPAEPRPERFLQLCHHINQPGHEVWLERLVPGSLLPPLAGASTQAANQMRELIKLKTIWFCQVHFQTKQIHWFASQKENGSIKLETEEEGWTKLLAATCSFFSRTCFGTTPEGYVPQHTGQRGNFRILAPWIQNLLRIHNLNDLCNISCILGRCGGKV